MMANNYVQTQLESCILVKGTGIFGLFIDIF